MLTAQQQFAQNDQEDQLRYAFAHMVSTALGIDTGASPYDRAYGGAGIYGPTGQNQIFSITTGTATQGQPAAPVHFNIAGYQVSVPMLLVIGAGAWFLLRKG